MYGFMCICIDLYVYIWVYMDVYGNLAMLTDFANSNTVDSRSSKRDGSLRDEGFHTQIVQFSMSANLQYLNSATLGPRISGGN